MEFFPTVFYTFKLLALAVGMFFAVKWHYDQGKKGKQMERRALIRAGAMAGAVFMLLLAVVVLGAFDFATRLELNLALS